MAAKPISQLPTISGGLTGNEQVPLNQGGATKRASVNDWAVPLAAFFPDINAAIVGINSVETGGSLGTSVTVQLVNDTASPGGAKYYGTDLGGTRGWYALTTGGTVQVVDTGVGLTGGPITLSGSISLATVSGVAGTYGSSSAIPVVTVDAYGRVSAASTVAGDFVPTTRAINTSGGLSGGGALSSDLTLTITDTLSSAASVGSSTSVPVLSYNTRGQLTSVSSATISISGLNGLADPGANGVVVRTTSNVTTARTITGTGNINVANGDGVAANPTITFSGILPLANGGTNAALTAINGGVVYSTTSALAVTNSAATAVLVTNSNATPAFTQGLTANRLLRTDGSAVTFDYVFLATDVSGALPIVNGGTGATTVSGAQSAFGLGALALKSTVSTIDIDNLAVTNAKLANMAANTVKVRAASTSGDPSDLALAASQLLGRGSTGDISAISFGTNLTVSGTTINASGGVIVDRAFASYTTNAALTTSLPYDDTIPQNTEGTQVLSASITPKSTTNRIRVRFMCMFGAASIAQVSSAFFLNSTANAIHATSHTGDNQARTMSEEWEFVPGSTSAQTIAVRVGGNGITIGLNGQDGSTRRFGGVAAATLVLEEITA